MDDYIQKLQEDLGKKLEHLGWMYFDPARRLADHFEELRRTVDYEAEVLIRKISEDLLERNVNEVNERRLEFIRILEELEARFLAPKTETTTERGRECSADASYRSFEQKVDQFMKSSESSLGDLEDSYLQLAQELLDESDRLERRISGEQTIIYWPHKCRDNLGSLVYFGDLFLGQREIDSLYMKAFPNRCQSPNFALLVPANKSLCLSKRAQVIRNLGKPSLSRFAEAPKFWYIGKSESEYAGFSAEGLSAERQFLSYQYTDDETAQLSTIGEVSFDTSNNLFDVYQANMCHLLIANQRMESLHVNLLPMPLERLVSLNLSHVHLCSIDTNLLAKLTHLVELRLQATFPKEFVLDLGFLRALTNLSALYLALPDASADLSMLQELSVLNSLILESFSFSFPDEKFPQLTQTALKQILSPPRLQLLRLSFFRIEILDNTLFSAINALTDLNLTSCRIDNIDAFLNPTDIANVQHKADDDLPLSGLKRIICLRLIDIGVRALSATGFAVELCNLSALYLAGNSIVELPRGVFSGLRGLRSLDLSRNRITYLNNGLFDDDSCHLTCIILDENPIKTIEAGAFVELSELKTLHLFGCRLKSIDSEMFIGLTSLVELVLCNNLIERIEVVTQNEKCRRVNMAKADFDNEERELVKKHLFKDMVCLRRLFLNKNELASIDLSCFSNLECLLELDLSSNMITKLTGTAEPGLMPRLETLNLKDNPFKVSAKDTFPTCAKLDRNQLNDSSCFRKVDFNETEALDDPNVFSNRTYVSDINLSGRGLNRIHRDIFKCLTNLGKIDLSGNRLSSIDLGLLRGQDRLIHLDISLNSVTFLNLAGLFRTCPNLMRLNIADNQLDDRSTAEPIDRRTSNSLREINLANNRFERMDFVQDMTNLLSLDLRGNRIQSVMTANGQNLLGRLRCLMHLDLSCNRIRTLKDEMFVHLRNQLENIDLSGNPHDIQLDSLLNEFI